MSTQLQQYVECRLQAALEALESGVQMQNIKEVRLAMATLQSLEGIVGYKRGASCPVGSYEETIRDSMIRATSAMCMLDRANALQYLQLGTQYDKENKTLQNNYGFCYTQQKQWDKAIAAYRLCLCIDPSYTIAYLGLSSVYRALTQYDKELEVCREGLSHCDKSAELYNACGLALLHKAGAMYDSQTATVSINSILNMFQAGLECSPSAETRAKLLVNTGHVHGLIGDYQIAVSQYFDALNIDPSNTIASQNLLSNLNYFSDPELSRSAVLRRIVDKFSESGATGLSTNHSSRTGGMTVLSTKLHERVCESLFSALYSKAAIHSLETRDSIGKLRIGYLVANPLDSRLSACTRHLWEQSNPHGFIVVLYHSSDRPLTVPGGAKCCSMVGRSSEDVAKQVEQDKIDILIDLCGHNPGNRLDVLALRPAPVLLSYLGYLADSGVRYVQRISDVYCEKRRSVSSIVRSIQFVPETPFVGYSGPKKEVHAQLSPLVKSYSRFKPSSSAVTFGCFSQLSRINASVIATWKVLLTRFPRGRLILRSRWFADPEVQELWRVKLGADALGSDRVRLIPEAQTEVERMAQYNMIDVHLDTFPAADMLSTLESLYMNVPVITLGPQHRDATQAQLCSASILNAARLTDQCVAANLTDYIEKAMGICNTFQHISVRKALLRSPISDIKSFMKTYENLLIDLYITGPDHHIQE